MTTRRRRSTGSRRSGYSRTRPRTRRRRASPGASLGTAVGVLLAGLLISRFERFPWWVWILILLVVVAAMAFWAVGHRAGPPPEEPPVPQPHTPPTA